MTRNKRHIPIVVYEVTDACNQKCRFCYNHWKGTECPTTPNAPDFRLARRTLKRLLRQASIDSLSLSGGEPALMPRLHDIALRARFSGANVNLLTNGTMLTEDDVDTTINIYTATASDASNFTFLLNSFC